MPNVDFQPAAKRHANDRLAAVRVGELRSRVGQVRGRWRGLIWAEGCLWLAGVLGVAIGIGLLLDWWLELPRIARFGLAVGYLAVAAWSVWTRIVKPLRALPDRDGLALFVERRRPDLRSRLISAVQLARAKPDSADGAAFVDRLVADADAATRTIDPTALVPADGLRRCARGVVPGLVAVGIGFALGWPASGILLRRAWLEEVAVPRKTRLVEVTGARTLGRGDDLTIAAVAEGVIPRSGQLVLRHGSGREQTLALDAAEGRAGRFERALLNVPSSFRYRVRVNDAESAEYAVEVLPRPVATNVVLVQVLPAYTGVSERRVEPGELTLLQGSRLRIEGQASQPLRRAQVRLGGLERTLEAAVDESEDRRFRAEIAAEDPRWTSFSLELEDRAGVSSRESAVYAVQVVADAPPQVRMILPTRREELVTPRGTVLISFEARDDYGLAGIRLRHQPAGGTNDTPAAVELDLAGEAGSVVRRRFDWALDRLRPALTEGGLVEFWIEAVDRNDRDGPGVGRSERHLLRVVSEAEKRLDLLTRASDVIGRLGDVAVGQEKLNESLGRIILAKPPGR